MNNRGRSGHESNSFVDSFVGSTHSERQNTKPRPTLTREIKTRGLSLFEMKKLLKKETKPKEHKQEIFEVNFEGSESFIGTQDNKLLSSRGGEDYTKVAKKKYHSLFNITNNSQKEKEMLFSLREDSSLYSKTSFTKDGIFKEKGKREASLIRFIKNSALQKEKAIQLQTKKEEDKITGTDPSTSQDKHGVYPSVSSEESSIFPIACVYCNRRYTSIQECYQHIFKRHNKNRDEKEESWKDQIPSPNGKRN